MRASTTKTISRITGRLCLFLMLVAPFGCASVPPQIAKIHQKELEIIESLQKTHLAMVDSFIDQKLQNFELFFFREYGPAFLDNWIAGFKKLKGREYDPAKDFPVLYSDLVAEYQAESAPIEKIRVKLRSSISAEYRNTISAHRSVGGWIDSLEKLNAAQRQTIDDLLGSIKPGFSLDSIDKAIDTSKANVEKRIANFQ